MALTLAEAEKLSNDVVLQGVIETILNDRVLLQMLPFIPVAGNGLTYNRENAAASAAFFDIGEVWAESTPTFTQVTSKLKVCGGDADVDNFLARTRGNVQDLEAAVIQLKAKAVADKIEDTLINGDDSVDSKSFDGLQLLITDPGDGTTGNQQVSMGTNGATLTLAKMDELIDTVLGGKPDLLLMSRRSRRTLNSLSRTTSSGVVQQRLDLLGHFVDVYDGIPIAVSNRISDAVTQGSNSDTSRIYAIRMGEGLFAGLTSVDSPSIVEVERIGTLEAKDATRTRVKAYVSCALFASKCCAKLIGVRA